MPGVGNRAFWSGKRSGGNLSASGPTIVYNLDVAAAVPCRYISDLSADVEGMKVRLNWTSADMGGKNVTRYEGTSEIFQSAKEGGLR
ncbi:AGAP004059-PA-like protein [Anopheles sinensis]|uniref:AGAP004059-PA-like protein n=1 Tax=Anopheles sinensis TaxID=74873 RepID=A0A084VTD4_ANOSI|nr:AGAP004059-PA-like protein [Anopheles sinensis]